MPGCLLWENVYADPLLVILLPNCECVVSSVVEKSAAILVPDACPHCWKVVGSRALCGYIFIYCPKHAAGRPFQFGNSDPPVTEIFLKLFNSFSLLDFFLFHIFGIST